MHAYIHTYTIASMEQRQLHSHNEFSRYVPIWECKQTYIHTYIHKKNRLRHATTGSVGGSLVGRGSGIVITTGPVNVDDEVDLDTSPLHSRDRFLIWGQFMKKLFHIQIEWNACGYGSTVLYGSIYVCACIYMYVCVVCTYGFSLGPFR